MTEQPPSASKEALGLAIRIRRRYFAPGDAGIEIDALIAQRVAAETERCALAARGGDHSQCGHGDGYMDGRLDAEAAIRAERPAPEGPQLSPDVVDYTERAREISRDSCGEVVDYIGGDETMVHPLVERRLVINIAAALSAVASERDAAYLAKLSECEDFRAGFETVERQCREANRALRQARAERDAALARVSAVACEREAAAIRAFGKRVWSDTEEVAYRAGVSDARARLREPEVRDALRDTLCDAVFSARREYTLADAAIARIAEMLK